MPPDLEAIAVADEGARRDIEVLTAQIAGRRRLEQERMKAEAAAGEAQLRAELAASIREVEDEASRRAAERSRMQSALDEATRQRAEACLPEAISAWLAIVRGNPPGAGGG